LHSVVFEEVADPRALLEAFVKLYWVGQVAPLPFFPLSAREFATKLKGNRLDALTKEHYQKALESAAKVYVGSKMFPGESEDLYISQLYQGTRCLTRDYKPFAEVPAGYQSFPEMSAELFVPLLRAREASPL